MTRQVQRFDFPEPADPFGKTSGRNLLTLAQFRVLHLMNSPKANLGPLPRPVNSIRRLKTWRMGWLVPGIHQE